MGLFGKEPAVKSDSWAGDFYNMLSLRPVYRNHKTPPKKETKMMPEIKSSGPTPSDWEEVRAIAFNHVAGRWDELNKITMQVVAIKESWSFEIILDWNDGTRTTVI